MLPEAAGRLQTLDNKRKSNAYELAQYVNLLAIKHKES